MRAIKLLIGAVGCAAVALGALWLLQGVGALHIRPILCFADCAPVQGASTSWAVAGLLLAACGTIAIIYAARR